MHDIYFYQDKNGNEPIKEFIIKLSEQKNKDSRIKLNKIQDYIQLLSKHGTMVGEPYMKHLRGDIWELRPNKNRILFTKLENGYVLLHHFVKKTQKTPQLEIEKAERYLADLRERI